MLVKIWLYLTKSVITGDVDEVRVQSEEPFSRKQTLVNVCFLHFYQLVIPSQSFTLVH